ncbi:MAG TPA: NRDE family protein [Cyclobacteriaceae bacterium]
MCLIFLSIKNHPKYKLIVAANRDEFYARKTAAAHAWTDYPKVIGGRDLEAMGTWMAMAKSGKLGMVTNYRDLKNINPNAPTRGLLVSDFLINDYQPEEYLKEIHLKADQYNGFNLLIGTMEQLYYYSNYQSKILKLESGTYGLSNALLDTPWPKVKRGKEEFNSVINQDEIAVDSIFEILRDEDIAPDNQLPNTGLDLDRERSLSAMFIKTPNYGSRCSTVVLVDKDNKVSYSERVYNVETFEFDQREFHFEAE